MTPPAPKVPRIGRRLAALKLDEPVSVRHCVASFIVEGPPKSKPRPRVTSRGTFMPSDYIRWRETVKDAAAVAFAELEERGEPWDARGAHYGVRARFFVERTTSGDADGLVGSVMDALNKMAWADDRLVVDLRVSKRIDKARPRVEVEIRSVDLETWTDDDEEESRREMDGALQEAAAEAYGGDHTFSASLNVEGSEALLGAVRKR